MKIYFDGGCRPNPGEMEAGVVAAGKFYHRSKLGPGTSEEAEWLGLLLAIDVARGLGSRDVLLLGDSLSVVNQAKRITRCRDARLRAHRDQLESEAPFFRSLRIKHVPRTQNLAGIALARAADSRLNADIEEAGRCCEDTARTWGGTES